MIVPDIVSNGVYILVSKGVFGYYRPYPNDTQKHERSEIFWYGMWLWYYPTNDYLIDRKGDWALKVQEL